MSQRNPTDLECTKYAEAFVSNGGDKTAAFRKAFPKSNAKAETLNQQASKFSNLHKVCTRVGDLHLEVNTAANGEAKYTAEDAIRELEEARLIAAGEVDDDGKRSFSNPSAMVSASMGKAKISGLLIDKIQSDQPPATIIINRPSGD